MRLAVFVLAFGWSASAAQYRDGYADSRGVKIHYVTAGSGPLVGIGHGFPDFRYTWRHRMDALTGQHKVAALNRPHSNGLSHKLAASEKQRACSAYARRFQQPREPYQARITPHQVRVPVSTIYGLG